MDPDLPLLLLPGLLNDRRVFAPQIAALEPAVEIVVADLTGADTIGALAAGVLAASPPRFALAGFSMGGYVAFEILRQAPERVARLALLDTQARPDAPEQTARREALIGLAAIGKFKGVTPSLLPQLVHPSRLGDRAVVDPILAMAASVGRDGFVRQQRAIMGRADSRPLLPAIRMPVLVLCGREDRPTPLEASVEMAEAIPGATLAVVDECGHMAPLERPAAVTAALAGWLAR